MPGGYQRCGARRHMLAVEWMFPILSSSGRVLGPRWWNGVWCGRNRSQTLPLWTRGQGGNLTLMHAPVSVRVGLVWTAHGGGVAAEVPLVSHFEAYPPAAAGRRRGFCGYWTTLARSDTRPLDLLRSGVRAYMDFTRH